MNYTSGEMMTVAASRALRSDDVVFVGIGAPSAACNLARLSHAPDITLIYESGTIGTSPSILPLSIGDGELAETAITNVSVPEMFRYWLQAGRISVGFLGAAQIDRFANINTTVIGDYSQPSVRLPGGGGAPEIASSCHRVFITMKQTRRSFVDQIDFFTSFGFGSGGDQRKQLGITSEGPSLLITDLAIWRPDPESHEFIIESLHPGVTREQAQEHCSWHIRFSNQVKKTEPPQSHELELLRDLYARSKQANQTSTVVS